MLFPHLSAAPRASQGARLALHPRKSTTYRRPVPTRTSWPEFANVPVRVRRSAALSLTRAQPVFSDVDRPEPIGGPIGTGFYLRLADSGERRPWNTDYNGYNAVGAGDFATPGTAPGEASSTAGGFLTLGGLRQRARAMAGDAGRALRTLAAVVADGAGRAMAGVKGLREARRDRRVRWRPRFGDG